MTDLVSVWQGSFNILGVDLKCHVLNNGQRIIEASSLEALLEAMGDPNSVYSEKDMTAFAKWRLGQGVP